MGTAPATVIYTGNKATVLANDHAARWSSCWDLLEERRKRQSGSGMLQNIVSMSVLVGIPSAFAIPWLGTPGFTSLLGMSASVFAGVCVAAVIVEHPQFACDTPASRKTSEEATTAFEYCILWSGVEAGLKDIDDTAIDWEALAKLLTVSDQELRAVFARIA